MHLSTVCSASSVVASLLGAGGTQAAISYSVPGSTLTETFGDFTGTASNTTATWTDNSTVPNWYSNRTSITYGYGGTVSGTSILYAFKFDANGNVSTPAASLGSRTTGSSDSPTSYAWAIVNNTGQTLSSFDLSYAGFVAHDQGKTADKIEFSYKVGGAFADAGYTGYSALDYVVSDDDTTSESGNPVAGYTQTLSETSVPVAWGNGQTLWLRWTDLSAGYSGQASMGVGIDNVVFSAAVPEPSVMSLLAATGLLVRRRRA